MNEKIMTKIKNLSIQKQKMLYYKYRTNIIFLKVAGKAHKLN